MKNQKNKRVALVLLVIFVMLTFSQAVLADENCQHSGKEEYSSVREWDWTVMGGTEYYRYRDLNLCYMKCDKCGEVITSAYYGPWSPWMN